MYTSKRFLFLAGLLSLTTLSFPGCSSDSEAVQPSTTASPTKIDGPSTPQFSTAADADITTTSSFSSSSTTNTGTGTGSASQSQTTVIPTPRPKPGKACTGKKLGTYTWSQDYWRNGDNQLFDFLNSDMGSEWNCGDVSINIADMTNYKKIADESSLVEFMKNFRRETSNTGVLWLTYGDVVSKQGVFMVEFVQTFKTFLERYIDPMTMAEIAPIGLSFDVEHVAQDDIKKALMDAQQMKVDLQRDMGYLPNSLFVQYTIEGAPDTLGTQYVMQYADSALMMLYRNDIIDASGNNPDDLLGRLRWMLHEQCLVCTQPGWENLRAKITIMVEGSCKMGNYCHKISMCAFDSASYPSPSGGIEYAWTTLQQMDQLMVPDGIVTQDQYNHLFNHDGTLFALHNWEWTKCYYGDAFSEQMGYNDYCSHYHAEAQSCRSL